MGLIETKKELEEQIAALSAEESQDDVQEDIQEETEKVEDPAKEETTEETPVEETKEEEPKQELTDSDYARLRREARALKKKLQDEQEARAQLESRINRIENGDFEEVEAPQKAPDPWAEAEQGFVALEKGFLQTKAPADYEDVSKVMMANMIDTVQRQNPRMQPQDVVNQAKKIILQKASNYLQEGFDPIEELYYEAKEISERIKPEPQKEPEKKVLRPDLDKVQANKARSANMIGAKGSGDGRMTLQHAVTSLSNAEWIKLPIEERERIMRGG